MPFTTGILIGIGETRAERIDSLLAMRDLHGRHGHIQDVIVQNFRAKPAPAWRSAAEPDADELLWTIGGGPDPARAADEHPGAAQSQPGDYRA